MKKMSQANSQDYTTWGTTHSEGFPTGVKTGESERVPAVCQQKMGSCTIQLVRVPEERKPKVLDPAEQLWWVTPATEVAVKKTYGWRGCD